MNANMSIEQMNETEKMTRIFYGGKTVDELLIVYANNKHEREEIRMHIHVHLMYKPHKMYCDAMKAMDAISE